MQKIDALIRKIIWAAHIGPIGIAKRVLYRVEREFRGLDFEQADNEKTGVDRAVGIEHAASGIADLIEAYDRLDLHGKVDSVLDIGCGKGAALIAFHRLALRKICGVELSPQMYNTCLRNLERMHLQADLRLQDATTIYDFSAFDLIYDFNAIPRGPLSMVLENVLADVRRTGKPQRILFANFQPADRDLLVRSEFSILGEVQRTTGYLLVQVNQ